MFLNGFNPPPSLILRFNGRRGKASKQAPVLPPTTKSSLYVEMFLFRETEKFGMNGMVNILVFKNSRVSCTSVATARSSASRMESPNPSSSSARTLAGYLGLCSTVASTRRVSLKSVTPNFLLIVICGLVSKREGRDGEHRRAQQNMENSTRTTKRVFGSIGNYTRWCADG